MKYGTDILIFLRNAKKIAFKVVRSFARQMKKSCGMDVLVFAAHHNEDGNVEVQQ